jgi:DNA-binding NarL/FixJ family response regulator
MQAGTKKAVKKTVLIVDDSPFIRIQVRELFLSDSFDLCAEAENGLQAIQIAQDCKPDVIILDLAMPVMSGIEAAPQLRSLFPKTPIILFSLHADYLKTVDCVSLGITATMSKNDPLENLLQKVHELMGD